MPASPTGGGPGALARFRRLVNLTALATLLLILIGGVVRVSDSGLGCGPAGSGTHGWPLCEGQVLPLVGGLSGETTIEFSHRVVAGLVGILALLIVWQAWRHLRAHRGLLRGSIFGLVLVLLQGGLGGLTVENNLEPWLVAAHLGLAMIFLATLLALSHGASAARQATTPARGGPLAASTPGLRSLAIVASLLLLATIVAGGYVAGTEGHGTVNQPAAGAHVACGQEFPGCAGGFMPFGLDPMIDAQLTHRLLMYLTAIAVIALLGLALARRIRHWLLPAIGTALLAQILLGAINVWAGKHAGLIVGHLMLGTTLWALVSYLTISLLPARSPRVARAHRNPPEAATA